MDSSLPPFSGLYPGTPPQLHAIVTVTAPSVAGSNDTPLTAKLFAPDGVTPYPSARQIVIDVNLEKYNHYSAISGTTTFNTVTKGSIIATSPGWALIQTDANGEFACTLTDTANETVYVSADIPAAGVSDVSKGLFGVISNSTTTVYS